MTVLPLHPLDPLSPAEITSVSTAVRSFILNGKTATQALPASCKVKFAYVTLVEPLKSEVIAYLGLATSPTDLQPHKSSGRPIRRAECAIIAPTLGRVFVFVVQLEVDETVVESFEKLDEEVQIGITNEELLDAEHAVRTDSRVIQMCADVGIPAECIVADCWSIGYDERFGPTRRLQQAFVYARLGPHEHLYAHPLDFNCVVDSNTLEVLHIDFASHRINPKDPSRLSGSTAPHSIDSDSLVQSGRERIAPPMESFDFLPDLLAETERNGQPWTLRDDVKPLQVVQPEGVSFKMTGNHLEWQNWDLHIGYNYREGMVLNQVQYFDKDEGRLRPILYRASFAEMVVPYAAENYPHPRKFAFDVGEYGLGSMANSLDLGCDCLGAVHYLDTSYVGHDGVPVVLKNVVCIHEEDDGLLWKHTDYRVGGRSHAVRSRKLIIQMVVTVANYEYLFAWSLRQDGTIELETKLTGILNLYTMAEGESAGACGTEVAPRVQAHHHQHLFCLRVDPMIDGVKNSVIETDIVPLDAPTGSVDNWAGNGFVTKKTVLGTTSAGGRVYDAVKGRSWSMVNEDKLHYSSKAPVGFKIMCKDFPPLLAKPDSLVGRRAPFATRNMWVTPYVDGQLYPAGKYVTQTRNAPEDSLEGWMKGDKSTSREDVVAWISFGVTHIPRPEDFPVMPAEHLSLILKPVGFFRQNPALDVPATTDKASVKALPKACCE